MRPWSANTAVPGRVWVFDRGIVSEENLQRLRRRGASYLVGTPRAQLKAYERRLLEGDWQSVSGEVEVQLIAEDNKETYVLARSRARAQKESAMRSRVVRGLMRDLIRLRRLLRHGRLKDPEKVLLHLGRLKERYRQAWRYVKISIEDLCLRWRWDREALRLAASRDGAYLLRTNLEGSDPVKLWSQYIQLTEVEAVFRALKSDLAIRPIWHFTPKRVEAHVMVAFLGYCLWVCLKHKLKASAPSLTPWQLLDQFARIQMVEVWFKLRAGGCICLERITQPEAAQAALIHQLDWPLPQQPPPKIYKTTSKMCGQPKAPQAGVYREKNFRTSKKCESWARANTVHLRLPILKCGCYCEVRYGAHSNDNEQRGPDRRALECGDSGPELSARADSGDFGANRASEPKSAGSSR